MAYAERVGNLGYLGIAPQSVASTPVAATDFVPLYEETLTTNRNLQDQAPIFGQKFEIFSVLPGMRDHGGDVTVLAEPNTATKFFDMLLTRGNVSGTDPYTWPFTLASSGETYYTFDVSTGNGLLKRFWGVKASKIVPVFNNNEMQLKISVSALGSFEGREIASVSGTGPYTVTLKTDYDPNPTNGLVTGDLIRFALASGTTIDATVASVTNGTTFTTSTNPTSVASGDFVHLRPQTVALNNLPSFLWSNVNVCFGATATAALSATPLPVETGSTWEIDHNFKDAKGEHRSGSQDPASLVRTTGNASMTIKKFFRDDADLKYYNNLAGQACVWRHYCYSGGKTYELRLTFNNIFTDDPTPQLKAKELLYSSIKYHPAYNQTDAQAWDAKVISKLSSIS